MVQFSVPKQPPKERWTITKFTGLNLNPDSTQIEDTDSPDMLNIALDSSGTPDKRIGYEKIFPVPLGISKINGLFKYKDEMIIAQGNKIFKWKTGDVAPTQIYNGWANALTRGFLFDNKLYLLNGQQYMVYDGTTFSAITPHIPTVMISTPPTGGGVAHEDWNLLSNAFTQSFNGDGVSEIFTLSIKGLDAAIMTVSADATDLVEGVGYTVDRSLGVINFSLGSGPNGAPGDAENNVIVTAYKTQTGLPQKIYKCRQANIYGGTNDTRVHLYGNTDEPDIVWRSGLNDPTYFPENQFNKIGTSASAVTGKINVYETSIIIKEDGIFQENFNLAEWGPSFPVKPINDTVGCISPGSVQLIENSPVFLSAKGVYTITSTQVKDERNAQLISEKVNEELLKYGLADAISIDYDNKYFLCFPFHGMVFVYYYLQQAWVKWDNIKASCFLEFDGKLYFGSNTEGYVYIFKDGDHPRPFNDDDEIISCFLTTKILSLGTEDFYKMIHRIHLSVRPGDGTLLDLYYRTDRRSSWGEDPTWTLIEARINMGTFNYNDIIYSDFTYMSNSMPQALGFKVKEKRIVYFQLRFENNHLNSAMGLLFCGVHYTHQREVR